MDEWMFPITVTKCVHAHTNAHTASRSLKQTPAWLSGIPRCWQLTALSRQSVDFTGAVSITCNWHPAACQPLFLLLLRSELLVPRSHTNNKGHRMRPGKFFCCVFLKAAVCPYECLFAWEVKPDPSLSSSSGLHRIESISFINLAEVLSSPNDALEENLNFGHGMSQRFARAWCKSKGIHARTESGGFGDRRGLLVMAGSVI